MAQRDTKVSELCLQLGVTKATIYRYVAPDGFLEKPRATGPWLARRSQQRPLTCDFAPLLSKPHLGLRKSEPKTGHYV